MDMNSTDKENGMQDWTDTENMQDWTDTDLTDEIEALGPEPHNATARGYWREDMGRVLAEIARRNA